MKNLPNLVCLNRERTVPSNLEPEREQVHINLNRNQELLCSMNENRTDDYTLEPKPRPAHTE